MYNLVVSVRRIVLQVMGAACFLPGQCTAPNLHFCVVVSSFLLLGILVYSQINIHTITIFWNPGSSNISCIVP